MRIISRYVLREHLGPLVFSLSALTSLLLLNYVAKQLPHLVGKDLPASVIVEFIVLSLPFTIAMTLPMAVLVSTLHAFSRLAADSEITAVKASGIALPRLMAPVIVLGLALTLTMIWFNDQVMPAANYRLQTLTNDIARKKPTFALRPQVINEVSPQRLYLRAGSLVGGSSEMRDVTIFDFSDATRRRTIRADSGHVELSADGRDLLLTLRHGSMTEVNRLEPERLQRVFFKQNFVRVRAIGNDLERNAAGGEKSDRERTVCELEAQLRVAVHQRDSLFSGLSRMDSAAARTVGGGGMAASSGAVYCAVVRLFRVKEAHAATTQGSAVQQPPQAPQAPQPPAIAPSVGIRPPDDPTTPVPVLVEGLKMQLSGLQRTIDGNQVEIEKKFAIATACVIFALLGAPIAFRFPRGGVGMTIGVSLGVFGVYYIGLIAGEELARRNMLPAFVAMWSTNAILLVTGVVLTARLGREGTTSRGSEMSDRLSLLAERVGKRLRAPAFG